MLKCENLVELLRWRAADQADERAFTFLVDGETEAIQITYGELDHQARTIGAFLQRMDAAGERIILLYPPGLDYFAAFFGCLYGGAVAVPAYPPRFNVRDERLLAMIANAQPSVLLTTSPTLRRLQRWTADMPELKALGWATTDDLSPELASAWSESELTPDTLAFLQYTSGSTATPRGVMLTHRSLMDNLRLVIQTSGFQPERHREGVSWLPPYHDMGLVGGILLGVYAGRPGTIMSPEAFMHKPLRWLQAISRTQATYSVGPNFAYELCVDRIPVERRADLDLSSWEIAIVGSDPVRYSTLERFAGAFGSCGFRREAFCPGYGMAEATLAISVGSQATLPVSCAVQREALKNNRVIEVSAGSHGSQALVGCGRVLLEHRVVIVDPETLAPCAPDQVGEIWVSGPSVAQGYWQRAEETRHTFQAYMVSGGGPFLRTGDLGFLKAGELFITGRLKDMIIIRGQNYYPEDIERTAEESHPALQPNGGAAFSIDVDDRERLVIVFELRRQHRKADVEEVAAAVRAAVAQAHGIETYGVVLIKPGHLPRTTSGKVQRYRCRDQFIEDTLSEIGASVRAQAGGPTDARITAQERAITMKQQRLRLRLETEVRVQLSEFLEIPPHQVDFQQSIQSLGLGSLYATVVKFYVEDNFGVELPPEIFYEDITVDEFVERIATMATAAEAESGRVE